MPTTNYLMSAKVTPPILCLFLVATLRSLGGEGYTNSAGIVMNPIPAGSFQMGQAERQKSFKNPWNAEKDTGADWDEAPVRQVKITHSLFMGVTEVTNAQYELSLIHI